MAITTIRSPQPYRITVGLSGTPSTDPANYTLTRANGGTDAPLVSLVWTESGAPTVAQLALDGPLLPGAPYVLTVTGHGSDRVAYFPPSTMEAAPLVGEDAEAELFGVDVAWIGRGLVSGRPVRRTGREAYKHDLIACAVVSRGDWFHLPDDGAGLADAVNGPGDPASVGAMQATLKAQWARDGRTRPGGIAVKTDLDSEGRLAVQGAVQSIPLDTPIPIDIRG